MADPARSPLSNSILSPTRHHSLILNAVAFYGFFATAALVAKFLVVPLIKRVLHPLRSLQSRGFIDEELQVELTPGPSDFHQPELRHVNSYSKSLSVFMPGEEYPTYFANFIPSPLAPEGIEWPSHGESSRHDPTLERTPSQKEPVFGMTGSNLGEKGDTARTGDTTSN